MNSDPCGPKNPPPTHDPHARTAAVQGVRERGPVHRPEPHQRGAHQADHRQGRGHGGGACVHFWLWLMIGADAGAGGLSWIT